MRGMTTKSRTFVLLAATVLAGVAENSISFGAAWAQAVDQRTHNFDIPAKPIRQAMNDIVRATGINVVFPETAAASTIGRPVHGSMSTAQAIGALLAGSGLQYNFTNANTVTIVGSSRGGGAGTSSDATTLAPIVVKGASATTEGTNSYGSGYANVAGKEEVALKETPQSVSVVTRKRIEDQNLTTLDQAIANATGMVVQQADSDRPAYYSRGFQVNTIQIGGVPTNIALPTSAQDLAMYDRVEVLRGPAGLLNGLGSPGGTINLVRKLPMDEFHVTDEVSAGSYRNLRNELDVTGPLNSDGSLRGRVVGTLQTQDFKEDDTYRRLGQIYGVLEGDVTDNTTIRGGAYYQRSPARENWVGVPVTTDYKFLDAPRSAFFGSPWNKSTYSQTGAFVELEHEFDNGWKTKATLNYARYQSNIIANSINSMVDPSSLTANIVANKWAQDDRQYGLDWYTTGPVDLGGREHKLTFGVNASHEDLGQTNYYGPAGDEFYSHTGSIFDWDVPEPDFPNVYGRHTLTNQYGVYGNARISLADPLTLVAGGRVIWWNSSYKPNADENYWGDTSTHDDIGPKAIPFAGLIYDLNDTLSVYGSYAKIFQPQVTRDVSGNLLAPVQGQQYEVGLKGSFLDDKLNASVALFSLTQKNRAMADPSDPTGSIYFAQGKARAQGVDFEISGRVTDQWNVFAGYTYTNTRNYDDSNSTDYVAFSSIAPRHLFKLWTTYTLPNDLDKWTIGGGLYASSSFYNEDSGGKLVAPGYMTASASVSYKINEHYTASLSVDNIFNREYVRSINNTTTGFYGDPRTFLFKVKATW